MINAGSGLAGNALLVKVIEQDLSHPVNGDTFRNDI